MLFSGGVVQETFTQNDFVLRKSDTILYDI